MIRVGARSLALVVAGSAAAGFALPAGAGVEIQVRPDGSKVMVNTGSSRTSPAGPAARSGGGGEASSSRPTLVTTADRAAEARQRYRALIEEHSRRRGLDPRLVFAVVEVESAYRPTARSHKGAVGLMQLMPATAAQLAVDDPYDPEQNVRGGTAYLARMLDRFGSLELALAAYNAGPEAVDRHGGVPPYRETRRYVERVLRLYDGRVARLPEVAPPPGRKPYIVRGSDGSIVITTDP